MAGPGNGPIFISIEKQYCRRIISLLRLRRGEIMGKNYKLVVGISEDGEIVEAEDGLKFSASEILEPERFSAFRSLDTIEKHLKMLTALDKEMLIDDFTHSINCIYEEVYALRAYITGTEKS